MDDLFIPDLIIVVTLHQMTSIQIEWQPRQHNADAASLEARIFLGGQKGLINFLGKFMQLKY